MKRFWEKVDKRGPDECWLWTAYRHAQGYGLIKVDRRPMRAHRLSYEIHNGPIPSGLEVCHTCDTPACINPVHLFLGTHAENMADMAKKGRSGPRFGGAPPKRWKMLPADVDAACQLLADGLSYAEVASRFGVHRITIQRRTR